jgi:hypothetical protein
MSKSKPKKISILCTFKLNLSSPHFISLTPHLKLTFSQSVITSLSLHFTLCKNTLSSTHPHFISLFCHLNLSLYLNSFFSLHSVFSSSPCLQPSYSAPLMINLFHVHFMLPSRLTHLATYICIYPQTLIIGFRCCFNVSLYSICLPLNLCSKMFYQYCIYCTVCTTNFMGLTTLCPFFSFSHLLSLPFISLHSLTIKAALLFFKKVSDIPSNISNPFIT